MNTRPLTILVIGTLPPPVGGAGVSLQHLTTFLSARSDVRLILVNTGGVRGHLVLGPIRFLKIVWRIFAAAAKADVVSLQPVPSGLPFTGPFAWAAARFWRRPFMIRMFGGQDFLSIRGLRGQLVRFFVRSTGLYLAQTKALVASARADGLERVEWYPTSRPMRPGGLGPVETDRICRKFVFLSHVKRTKGIEELLEAAERMPEGVTVDVYGPLMDGASETQFRNRRNVRYCGVLEAGKADELLPGYDALVFPTYWPGEGYPGVILEAYGAGLPVIATRWKAIPEIVDDTCGLLVEPRNADELAAAMKKLVDDPALYRRLCEGVRAKRQFFDSAHWVDEFVRYCRELAAEK